MIKLSIDEMDTENITLDPPQENKNKNKEKVRRQKQEWRADKTNKNQIKRCYI